MELSEILTPDLIIYPLEANSKEEVILVLVDRLYKTKKIANPDTAVKAVLEREKMMTTGVGKGVALPHGKYGDIDDVVISVGISIKGIDFDAVDGQPVHIFVLLLTPERFPNKHLKLLSKFSRMLNKAKCREEILDAVSAEEIAETIYKYDTQV
ncbi:MAG: hypothetical protein DRP89_04245 [Candidatus Neomarinimicrobiota bacterium]|nr:MAG: hypothetical protein DRP89_04245 [Candidatus Neomarinimicrobiota bacterium]